MVQDAGVRDGEDQGRRRPPENETRAAHHKSGIVHQDMWASRTAPAAAITSRAAGTTEHRQRG